MSRVPPNRYSSPLRYPGGKGKIANFIKLLFLENGIIGHGYVEPYAGGASVALSLLYEEYASSIHINDLNSSVFAFWNAVLNDTEALCRLIIDTPPTLSEWKRQKEIQQAKNPEPLDLAFSTFFLNRTNRSGIIGGGIIGGQNQDGRWKLDARYNQRDLVRRIEKVARFKSRITLTKIDAADYLRTILPKLPADTFVYLDPPYYVKGEGLYEHFYQHEDHEEIARLVRRIKHPWVVSYDADPAVLGLYNSYASIQYGLSYSAAERYRGAEVMFFSPKLKTPSAESPANIDTGVIDKTRRSRLVTA